MLINWIENMRCISFVLKNKLCTEEEWDLIEKKVKYRVISLDRNIKNSKPKIKKILEDHET